MMSPRSVPDVAASLAGSAVASGAAAGSPGDVGPACLVAHVADACRRYSGEPVTLYTRVDVLRPILGLALRIGLPDGLSPGDCWASASHGGRLPELLFVEGQRFLSWTVERRLKAGERCEYRLQATVESTETDLTLESRALVMARVPGGQTEWADETVSIAVVAQGRYLRYLPAVYAEEDALMGRFLMLFESFWGPLDNQIANIHYYLDPKTAPVGLLPWLASWVDLTLDEQWSEERQRRLIAAAAQLHRRRGTRRGMQDLLEIYSGTIPKIIEHRAENLRLGAAARLGQGVALGQRNVPGTFTVIMRLPPVSGRDEAGRRRKEAERRRVLEMLIEAEKPAHTAYALQIETTDERMESLG